MEEGTARIRQQPLQFSSTSSQHHVLPPNFAPHSQNLLLGSHKVGTYQNFCFRPFQSQSQSPSQPLSRTSPQPEIFDCLPQFTSPPLNPPYSPEPPSSTSLSDPISNSKDVCILDDKDSLSNGTTGGGRSQPRAFPLPPPPSRKGGHRRSNSDIPFGFNCTTNCTISTKGVVGKRKSEEEVGDDLFNTYMNLDDFNTLNLCCVEGTMKSGVDNNSDDADVECSSSIIGNPSNDGVSLPQGGGVKGSGGGDRTTRHYRSISMDSFVGNINFADESPLLKPLPSPSSSKLGLQHGHHGEFSAAQMEKIAANEKLAEIASSDPKRAKRILANRVSAARSKERKTRYISELEHKVQTLQTEATTLSAQVTLYQRDLAAITSQNKELKFRVEAMGQQAQLKDALNQALSVEVQRLRLAAAELKGEAQPSNRTWPVASLQMTHQRNHPQPEEHSGRAG